MNPKRSGEPVLRRAEGGDQNLAQGGAQRNPGNSEEERNPRGGTGFAFPALRISEGICDLEITAEKKRDSH